MDIDWVEQLLLPSLRPWPMTNAEIYREIEYRARRGRIRLSRNWKATVRNTLQRHARGHRKCNGRVLFVYVGRGQWRSCK